MSNPAPLCPALLIGVHLPRPCEREGVLRIIPAGLELLGRSLQPKGSSHCGAPFPKAEVVAGEGSPTETK